MKFGKLSDISKVDFALPKDRSFDLPVQREDGDFKLYVGAPSWGNRSWVGKVYPAKCTQRLYLQHYAKQFNTIELNSVYYGTPKAETIAKWSSMCGPEFRFSPKVSQYISHQKKLKDCEDAYRKFLDAMAGFGANLGPCFMTLPESFGLSQFEKLQDFVKMAAPMWPLAIELRAEEWFQEPLRKSLFALFAQYHLIPILTDVSGRRDMLHMRLTNSTVIVRFVGNELHETDYSRMDEWAERLAKWKQKGIKAVYFFLHQPEETLVPELANYLIEKTNLACGSNFPQIRFLDKAPEQGTLF